MSFRAYGSGRVGRWTSGYGKDLLVVALDVQMQ